MLTSVPYFWRVTNLVTNLRIFSCRDRISSLQGSSTVRYRRRWSIHLRIEEGHWFRHWSRYINGQMNRWSLSSALKEAEKEVGFEIFTRSRSGVALTKEETDWTHHGVRRLLQRRIQIRNRDRCAAVNLLITRRSPCGSVFYVQGMEERAEMWYCD